MEYDKIINEEKLQQEHLESLKSAEIRLRYLLGVDTDKIEITGGILSSDSSKSHLIGRKKQLKK